MQDAPVPSPDNTEIFNYIKILRRHISVYQNSIPLLDQSREVALTNTHLERAFAWLGKTLEFLGSKSPYTQSENPASTLIEPIADTDESTLIFDMPEPTQTAKVKYFRSKLSLTIDVVEPMISHIHNITNGGRKCLLAIEQVFISLTDAKMDLGWELGRQKKIADKTSSPSLRNGDVNIG